MSNQNRRGLRPFGPPSDLNVNQRPGSFEVALRLLGSALLLASLGCCVNIGFNSPLSNGPQGIPHSPPFSRLLYVTNSNDNTVSIYTVNSHTGLLRLNGYAPTSPGAQPISILPTSVAVDPSGGFVYVASGAQSGSGNVSQYTVEAGELLSAPAIVVAGGQSSAIAVDPNGKFVYVANAGDGTVSAYTIITSGALNQINCSGGSSICSGNNFLTQGLTPTSIAMDPTGRFLYVTNGNSGNISQYIINATTGVPSFNSSTVTGHKPASIAVDPTGTFVEVVNSKDNTLSAFSINPTNGTLTFAGSANTGKQPTSVAIDPSQRYVYVTNFGDGTVSIFHTAANGAPSALPPANAGNQPTSIVVDPTGTFAYVANYKDNTVQMYTINNGGLFSMGIIRARSGPNSIAMTAGAEPIAYTPKLAFVANNGGNNLSQYTIGATGALSPPVTVDVGNGPTAVVVDPTGQFAYVTNSYSSTVSVLQTNIAGSGAATQLASPVCTGGNPASIAVDPSGRFAYVADESWNAVSEYTILGGGLSPNTNVPSVNNTPCQNNTIAAGNGPVSITVDPTGQFAYVANSADQTVSAYTINPNTGVLMSAGSALPLRPLRAANVSLPLSVTVDPTGQFAYVADRTRNTLWQLAINASTGVLTNIPPFSVSGTGATGPASVAVDPTINPTANPPSVLYTGNQNTVSAYGISPSSGILTPIGSPFPFTVAPPSAITVCYVAVDPSGQFLYVANSPLSGPSFVAQYSIGAGGVLSPLSPATVSAGNSPQSIAIAGTIQ